MNSNHVSSQDFMLWRAICQNNVDQVRKNLTSANVNSRSPNDMSTPLHLAVQSGCKEAIALVISHNPNYSLVNVRNETATELALRLNRKDIGKELLNAEFEQCDVAEAIYQLMKRSSIETLDLFIECRKGRNNCLKESLAKAWRRFETENVKILPEVENFVHLMILRFEWEAINEEIPMSSASPKESVMEVLMDGIDQLTKKQDQDGKMSNDVDDEFLEMLRAILKLLEAVKKLKYYPVYKLKFCVAIYLAIHDRKPSFNIFNLLIDKVMVVNFLNQFRKACINPSVEKRMTEKLLLDLNKILMENSNFNNKTMHILNLWGSYFKNKNMDKLYTQTEQIMIHSFLRKSSIKETLSNKCNNNVSSEGFKFVTEVSNSINEIFTSRKLDLEFKTLTKTFFNMKDLYSLMKVKNHLNILENIHSCTKYTFYVRVLSILRVIQVIGETLKSTSETPNISSELRSLLLDITPDRVLDSITKMRNFLSFNFSDSKYSFYKEASENKVDFTLYIQHAKDLLNLKQHLEEAFKQTMTKCLKVFLRRILQSESTEQIHSNCKALDLQPILQEPFNFNFFYRQIDQLFIPCINLLLMLEDLDELKHISRLYLRSLSCVSFIWHESNFNAKEKIIIPTAVQRKLSVDTHIFEEMVNNFRVLRKSFEKNDIDSIMVPKAGIWKEKSIITSEYVWYEKEQLSELKLFDNIQFNEFFNRLNPFFKNVLNKHEKTHIFKTVCKSFERCLDAKEISLMREKDNKNDLNMILKQMLQDIAKIISVGNTETDEEMASMITFIPNCKIKLAAIEMIMLDALEILNDQKVVSEYPSLISSARPVISGKFLRNYLAHDSLIYDAICRNSMNRHVVILLNGICLFRYLKVDLLKRPKPSKHLQSGEIEKIDFEILAGKYKEHEPDHNTDTLKEIVSHINYLIQFPPNDIQVNTYCDENKINEEKWKEMILLAISSKDESSAQALIFHFWMRKMKLPIASFLLPAVTKRMKNLVQHICALDPANIDYAPEKPSALYRAVEVGCAESVKILLQFNATVHQEPHSPLLKALELRRENILHLLMSSNEALAMNQSLQSKVIEAAATFNYPDLLKKYKKLIKESDAISLLKSAIEHNNLKSAEAILNINPNLIKLDTFQYACSIGSLKMVELFLSRDAEWKFTSGCVLLDSALQRGNRPLFRVLLKKVAINEKTSIELFQRCLRALHPELAWDVLQAGHPFGKILDKNDWDGVKSWLPKMCRRKPKIIDSLDGYVLGLAILDGMNSFVKKIFKKLIPNFSEYDHGRSLNCAIKAKDHDMLEFLLAHGCNVNCADASGLTPLGIALSLKNVSAGERNVITPNRNEKNRTDKKEEEQKLQVQTAEILEILLKAGADVNKKSKLFLPNHDSWIFRDHVLQTYMKVFEYPITIAVLHDQNELIEVLLNKGASVDVYNDDGKSPLIKCMEMGFIKMTDRLLDLGANFDYARRYRYPDGSSVLHYIAQHYDFKMYKHLVDNYKFDEL